MQQDVNQLIEQLERGETPGDRVQDVGDFVVYKARVASRDMQRGKSGGFRVIYYLHTAVRTIVLTIYAKTTREDISAAEILEIIKEVLHALEVDEAGDRFDSDIPPAE